MGKRKRDNEGKEDSPSDVEGAAEETKRSSTPPPPAKRSRLGSDDGGDDGAPPDRSQRSPTLEEESLTQSENLQLLISAFSNSQQDQYEIFRRSTFPKSAVRKIMQGLCSGGTVPQNAVIAMAGITKVFVGEIVEEACQSRDSAKEEGPLQPKHIREAVRRLKNSNKLTNSKYKKVFSLH